MARNDVSRPLDSQGRAPGLPLAGVLCRELTDRGSRSMESGGPRDAFPLARNDLSSLGNEPARNSILGPLQAALPFKLRAPYAALSREAVTEIHFIVANVTRPLSRDSSETERVQEEGRGAGRGWYEEKPGGEGSRDTKSFVRVQPAGAVVVLDARSLSPIVLEAAPVPRRPVLPSSSSCSSPPDHIYPRV